MAVQFGSKSKSVFVVVWKRYDRRHYLKCTLPFSRQSNKPLYDQSKMLIKTWKHCWDYSAVDA
jgi:hypothetical protein